jgi:predicted dehydrogenase
MARSGRRRADQRAVGYAVIGLGHIAQAAVLPAFRHARTSSTLAALVSGDAAKRRTLGERYGVPVYRYEDLDDVLARDDVDAVYIALPNTMHAQCAMRCARAGVHVLTEKPMATSEEDCRRMIAAADESGVKLMVAYRLHFEPANVEAVELVRSGRIGEPRFFSSGWSARRAPSASSPRSSTWGASSAISRSERRRR